MRYLSAQPVECLYRELARVLGQSGFEQIPLDTEAVANGTPLTAFVTDDLRVDIDPARGPAVTVLAHDGLISVRAAGWRAHFGPATPVQVITAAALAARVVQTRADIVALIQEQQQRAPHHSTAPAMRRRAVRPARPRSLSS
jgi:hypothetical protein